MTTIYYAIKPPNKSPDNNFNTNPLFNMLDEQLIPLYKDLKQEQDKSVPRQGSFFHVEHLLIIQKICMFLKTHLILK